jgi:hypothetical protein
MLRQSQFERRIAVELLHARHEKDVIRENFISKEREIEEKRAKEFFDALEKERVCYTCIFKVNRFYYLMIQIKRS